MSENEQRRSACSRIEDRSAAKTKVTAQPWRMGGPANESMRVEKVRASPNAASLIERLWTNIMDGSLVLVPLADRGEGWREAVVQERHGQIVTLRWWNAFTRRLKEVALLHPKMRL